MTVAQDNKHLVYSNIAEKMRAELSSTTLPKNALDEKKLMDLIHAKWNAVINNGSYWYNLAKEQLKYSALLGKLRYEIKHETLRIGRKILKEARKHKFKCPEAKRKQRIFIEELQDRLEFISVHY